MGELAALGTSILWSFTSMLFTFASRRVGPMIVNRIRLIFAVIFILLTHLILRGELIPSGTNPERLFWLGTSGIVGLVIGDACLFQAFVLVGTRLSMLLLALAPIISTLFAWIFLGEVLDLMELIAILITVVGIVWVVQESHQQENQVSKKEFVTGILFGIGGAFGQALGLVTAK
jgi:drug/metabolite transporter (DMT)-like permease